MARYSRRTGPAANLELTGAFQEIPGLTVTRHYDAGELLIIASLRVNNATAGTSSHVLRLMLDGAELPQTRRAPDFPAGIAGTLVTHTLTPIAAGRHTIAVELSGSANPGDTVTANQAELTVIQLPLWDQDTDIT